MIDNQITVEKIENLCARYTVCSDKSITIRAILIAAIAEGKTVIRNPLDCEDTRAAIACAEKLGAKVRFFKGSIEIDGATKFKDGETFDCGRSGTVLRLLCGLLSGLGINAVIGCDDELKNRPIGRIIEPLTARGAKIQSTDGRLPLKIFPSELNEFVYEMPIDSAQVKSAVLLSGTTAKVKTVVVEKNLTREHTEKMLPLFGVKTEVENKKITVYPSPVRAASVDIPRDPSAAAYFVALGILKGKVKVCGINVSEKRAGYLYKLKDCGAKISFLNRTVRCGEPCADVIAEKSELAHIFVNAEGIPSMIDELPVIGLIGAFNSGATFRSAAELRVKESDRLLGTVDLINRAGGSAREVGNDLVVDGGLDPAPFTYSSNDHRLTMTAFVAMRAGAGGTILNPESVNKSFPGFFESVFSFNACLIGLNVEKSPSAIIHNYFLEKLGVVKNYSYELKSVDESAAVKIIQNPAYKSINATIPYKKTVCDLIKNKSVDATLSDSVNFVTDGEGYTFDGDGLLFSLLLHGVNVKDKNVLVCGAGGAGRSVALALARAGAKVFVQNRTTSKAERFVEKVNGFFGLSDGKVEGSEKHEKSDEIDENSKEKVKNREGDVKKRESNEFVGTIRRSLAVYAGEPCEIVVNATSVKDELPANEGIFAAAKFAVDINYGKKTAFLKKAEEKKIAYTDGKEMLFAQSYFADALVSGVSPTFDEFKRLYGEFPSILTENR